LSFSFALASRWGRETLSWGRMVFAPCPRYGRRRVTGSPRTPIFWSVRFVLRFSCPLPQCEGGACQGRLEAKKAGGLEWWPLAPRLFCWKAYTLALTQSGVALHWHASKTANWDAELGVQPGDVARIDGAEGLGRRDESAGRRGSRLGSDSARGTLRSAGWRGQVGSCHRMKIDLTAQISVRQRDSPGSARYSTTRRCHGLRRL
jgi:hypothetical protein